jgi:hypothetical protein
MRVRHPAVEATLTLVDRPERMRTDGALDALGWKCIPRTAIQGHFSESSAIAKQSVARPTLSRRMRTLRKPAAANSACTVWSL